MSRQYFSETPFWSTSAGTAIATSTTETILVPNTTIPANYMNDGRLIRLKATGAYGTTATPTLIFRVRWGGVSGTVLSTSSTITTTSGTGSGASMTALWVADIIIQTRSNGSAGTLFTNGDGVLFNSANPTSGTVTNYGLPFVLASGATGGTTPVAVTADLTADTALSFTAQWGTSNAANSIRLDTYSVESLN